MNVNVPTTLAFLDKEVGTVTEGTWSSSIRPYLRFTLARVFSDHLSKRFVHESFAMAKDLSGQAEIEPRWKRCARVVDRGIGEALAIPFVKEKLGPEGKDRTDGMIKEVEASMLADLAELAWMDDATRERAEEKVHKLVNMVGYPDKWRSYDSLADHRKSFAAEPNARHGFEMQRQLAQDRQAGRPRTSGHDAADGERLLRPADERDGLPRGHPAAAVLLAQRRAAVNFGGHRRGRSATS